MLRLILLVVLGHLVYRTWKHLRGATGSQVAGRPAAPGGRRIHVDRSRVVDAEFRDVPPSPQDPG